MRLAQLGLLFSSIVWIAVLVIVFFSGGECSRTNEPVVLACLTANEIGDFLAGAFAPLAFIWLAFAVFIQARELKAQREELSLTRQEMKLSREVAEDAKEATRAQADEARRSGDYFKKQTEILEYEDKLRKQDEAKRDYDSFCKSEQHPTVPHTSVYLRTEYNDITPPRSFKINIATTSVELKDILSKIKYADNLKVNNSTESKDILNAIYVLDEIDNHHEKTYIEYIDRLSTIDVRLLRIEDRKLQQDLIRKIQEELEKLG